MKPKRMSILIPFVVVAVLCSCGLAACPSADLTGDCFVDYEDFALMAAQWLTSDPCIPDDMTYIPGGTFQMGDSFSEGDSPERPVHTVAVDSFYMGNYEVTNQQYCDFLNSAYDANQIKVGPDTVYASSDDSNSHPYCRVLYIDAAPPPIAYFAIGYSAGAFGVLSKGGRDMSNDPMVCVSWHGAAAYCNWRSRDERRETSYNTFEPNWPCDFNKKGYRLPTEAEWEYAARGGLAGRRFPWGNDISHSQANYYCIWDWEGNHPRFAYDVSSTPGPHPTWNDGVIPYTSPVASFAPNGYGLYDMSGNACEWCNDWYQSDYYTDRPNPDVNPTGPNSGSSRVYRGGSWGWTIPRSCGARVAFRSASTESPGYDLGFRLVLDIE